LHRHHNSPTEFSIRNGGDTLEAIAVWDPPDRRVVAAWGNDTDATEAGGYACAIAAVELAEGLFAVRRAETLTGADYYIANREVDIDDLESCLRLEVSGTDAPTRATLEYRLKEKIEQTRRGRSNLPAFTAVVGFRVQLILIERVL